MEALIYFTLKIIMKMKKQNLFSLLLLVLLFGACQDNEIQQEPMREESNLAEEFIEDNCFLNGNHINDGDQADDRHALLGNYIPVFNNACGITVFIENDCNDNNNQGNNFRTAVLQSIANYNNITNTSLYLVETNNVNNADIVIRCGNGPAYGDAGKASPEGDHVRVDLYQDFDNVNAICVEDPPHIPVVAPTACQLTYIAMHEMGHAIGFAHNDDIGGPITHIDGTLWVDEFSIFNSGGSPAAFCADICQFSNGDIQAIRIVYPVVNPNPTVCKCECEIGDPNGPYYEQYSYPINCSLPACWEPYCTKVTTVNYCL